MNERIQELADQATEYTLDIYRKQLEIESPSTVFFHKIRDQKFAELIAGKCCAILNEMHSWQTMNNQEYSSNWHDAVDQGIEHIKEQFGVEL